MNDLTITGAEIYNTGIGIGGDSSEIPDWD
jgi:hypothetical protein